MTRCRDVKASFPPSPRQAAVGAGGRGRRRAGLAAAVRPPRGAGQWKSGAAARRTRTTTRSVCEMHFMLSCRARESNRWPRRRRRWRGGSAASGSFAESDLVPVPTNCILCCFFFFRHAIPGPQPTAAGI